MCNPRRVRTSAVAVLAWSVFASAAASKEHSSLLECVHRQPGADGVVTHTRWLAPLVEETRTTWGDPCPTREDVVVKWYDERGDVVRTLPARRASAGHVVAADGSVHGTAHHWRWDPEARSGGESSLEVSEDGRFMLWIYWRSDEVEVHTYDRGRRTAAFGPFRRAAPCVGTFLASDGHAVIPRAGADPGDTALSAVGPDGGLLFETTQIGCPTVLAFNGETLLLWDGDRTYRSCVVGGETARFVLPAACFLDWVPGSSRALFQVFGPPGLLALVDCFTGGVEWVLHEPATRTNLARGAMAFGEICLVASLDATGRRPPWAVDLVLRALSTDDGRTIAVWRHHDAGGATPLEGRFLRHRGDVYWMGGDRFSRIEPADILGHLGGWRPPR